MIALDTNVLVRYLVQDHPEQAAIATRIIEDELTPSEPGFLSLVVLVELSWVLDRIYRCPARQVANIIAELLASPTLLVEQSGVVAAAIARPEGELADNLLHEVGKAHGCAQTVTFDRRFARLPGVELAGERA